MLQRSHKLIVVLFSLIFFSSSRAQNIFRQPKTMHAVIGRQQNENRAWMYQFSPQYVKNATLYSGPRIVNFYRRHDPDIRTKSFSNYVKKNLLFDPITQVKYMILPPPDFYWQQMGFFCKTESQLDHFSPLPLRFRLGSKEYVDYLENKPNSVKPRY